MTDTSPRHDPWRLSALVIGVLVALLTITTIWVTALNGGLAEAGIGEHVAWLRGANEPGNFSHAARRNGFGTPA